MIEELLKAKLEPYFSQEKFNQSAFLQTFCNESYLKALTCFDCNEQCVIKKDEPFYCLSGEIDNFEFTAEKALRYKFSINKFAQEIISKNCLKPILQKEADNAFTVGEKIINGISYKVVYLLDVTDGRGKVKGIAIQRMRALNLSQSRLIVITPDNFINDNAEETRLNNEGFEVLQLDESHKADFVIKGLKHFEIKDIDVLCKKFELVLTGSKEFYYLKAKITSSPQEMQLLIFLIDNQNKIIKVDDCMKHLWGIDNYFNYDKKQFYNIGNGLKRKFKKADIREQTAENFITIKNSIVTLNVDPKKIHK